MDTYTITDFSHLNNAYAISQIIASNRAFCYEIETEIDLLNELHNAMSIRYLNLNSTYVGSLLDIRELTWQHALPIQSHRICVLRKSDVENYKDGNIFIQEISGEAVYIYLCNGKRFNLLLDDTDSVMGKLDYEY